MEWRKFDDDDLRGAWIHQRTGELRLAESPTLSAFDLESSEPLGKLEPAEPAHRGYIAIGADGRPILVSSGGGPKEFRTLVEAARALFNHRPYAP